MIGLIQKMAIIQLYSRLENYYRYEVREEINLEITNVYNYQAEKSLVLNWRKNKFKEGEK